MRAHRLRDTPVCVQHRRLCGLVRRCDQGIDTYLGKELRDMTSHGGLFPGTQSPFIVAPHTTQLQTVYTGAGRGSSCVLSQVFFNRSEEHTSELQSQSNLVCRLLLEK